jgi:hypothetical protein
MKSTYTKCPFCDRPCTGVGLNQHTCINGHNWNDDEVVVFKLFYESGAEYLASLVRHDLFQAYTPCWKEPEGYDKAYDRDAS